MIVGNMGSIQVFDMLERMEGLDPHRLPSDWDGSIALTSK